MNIIFFRHLELEIALAVTASKDEKQKPETQPDKDYINPVINSNVLFYLLITGNPFKFKCFIEFSKLGVVQTLVYIAWSRAQCTQNHLKATQSG